MMPDGTSEKAAAFEDIGLLLRPIVTQISRWDRLKGWPFLIRGFCHLKENMESHVQRARSDKNPRKLPEVLYRRYLEQVRLVLGGPDPAYIQDDPEGVEVFEELKEFYKKLPFNLQKDIAILELPMESSGENAIMVNALQRCSNIVAQNSLQEGFGLTATEAMFKRIPVMGTHACGLRQQIQDNVHGKLVKDPTNAEEISYTLNEMLRNPYMCDVFGNNAEKNVVDRFLVFTQATNWLNAIVKVIDGEATRTSPSRKAG